MTATERDALISQAYDYMATIGDQSYDEYRSGESIDKFVSRGSDLYRVIRALGRYASIEPSSNIRFIESRIMTLANIYGIPRSALFTSPSTQETIVKYVVDAPLGSIAVKDYWQGTQAEYDALGSYDSNTLYFIVT
jgi:hypothetical protein